MTLILNPVAYGISNAESAAKFPSSKKEGAMVCENTYLWDLWRMGIRASSSISRANSSPYPLSKIISLMPALMIIFVQITQGRFVQ